MNFKKVNILSKALFVIYADFECVLVPLTDNSYNGPNTETYQDLIVYSYGYSLVFFDKKHSKPYKSYFVEDAIESF